MYEVIVGNIGSVYYGSSPVEANRAFGEYKSQSETNYGRAAGEDVTLLENGEIIREFQGTLHLPSNSKRVAPTAHQIARLLLEGPDLPITINGWGSDEGLGPFYIGGFNEGDGELVVDYQDEEGRWAQGEEPPKFQPKKP